MDLDNVTFRLQRQQRANYLGDLSSSSLLDSSRISLPNSMLDQSDTVVAFHQKIKDLENKLTSANNEVDNLLIENENLRKTCEKNMKLIELYKKIDFSDGHSTPSQGRKRKKPRIFCSGEEYSTSAIIIPTTDSLTASLTKSAKVDNEIVMTLSNELKICSIEPQKTVNLNDKSKLSPLPQNKTSTLLIRCRKQRKSNKKLLKQTRRLLKKLNKLASRFRNVNKENLTLQHKIAEMEATMKFDFKSDIQTQNRTYHESMIETYKESKTIKSKKVFICSDGVGKALGSEIRNKVDDLKEVINFCKPGASYLHILDKVNYKGKDLIEGDAFILINTYYDEAILKTGKHYVHLINNVVNDPTRTFNMPSSSVADLLIGQLFDVLVALIFGIYGACRRQELHNITTNDIERQNAFS
ncbi:unnamed protein product [Diatraea saccharalis]|uniref:Uncharacterized protein n=1 Tax=Diatraea saccharalis TaxID=40085 RepID=A0A9N9RDU4_9NEOP|nr:unnamed protein product [Diatraea saccharalis]